jgi:L-alanine-DL-glutamate epimerase-like enolase superfamily enzyme
MELSWQRMSVALRAPLRAAWGTLRERALLAVELRAADGLLGVGEAAPLAPYDGVTLERTEEGLAALGELLREFDDVGTARAACRAAGQVSHALAAVDMALWDLAGRRAGRPLAALLPGPGRPALARVPVNASVAVADRAGAARRAADAARAGFSTIKVKVGLGDDPGRLAAVRAAAGPDVALRLDANGAWSVAQAEAMLRALEPVGLQLCEEPVHGVEALRAVRQGSPVAIAMDETDAPGSGAADFVCLKVGRCGGPTGVMQAARAARAAGSEVYLASAYDGPRGIAAALHCAAALHPPLACGLATLELFAEDVAPRALRVHAGEMEVPTCPGLGVA